jgi:hypothetical protein
LNAVPDNEAVRRLQSLKKEIDTSVIMSTLRQNGDPREDSTESSTSTTPGEDTFCTTELSPQYPNAYPNLPNLDFKTLQEATYQQLITPVNRKSPGSPTQVVEPSGVEPSLTLCDSRLLNLDITKWTDVLVTSKFAAHSISLYLETDHPLLGFFEPNLFVADLSSGAEDYCSSLLVNSLLYWACVSLPPVA